MANINISFNNKNYNIDESALSTASSALKSHLSSVMNGTGATIQLGGTTYNIDSAKLSTTRNAFISHLGTISGSGHKVNVGGIEYGIDATKMAGVIADLHAVFGGLHSSVLGCDTLYWDGNTEGLTTATADKTLFKISDITPPIESLANGVIQTMSDGTVNNLTVKIDSTGCMASGGGRWTAFIVVYEPISQFPEAGIYACLAPTTDGGKRWAASMTIPGYTGFPHSENCGHNSGSEALGFPIEWNTMDVIGNPSAVMGGELPLVKVSDFIPTAEDFVGTEAIAMGAVIPCVAIQEMFGLILAVYGDSGMLVVSVATAGEYSDAEVAFPEAGLYVSDLGSTGFDADIVIDLV